MSLARRHRTLMLAAAAAVNGALPIEQRPNPGPEATEYELMRAQLGEDLRRLKEVKSIERKIELKRELAPKYFPWVEGALRAAEESGTAGPDDIVTQVMIWSIDVGAYQSALHLARHMIRFGLQMPERFDRDVEAFVAESIADAALKAIGCGETFVLELLLEVEEATEAADMHDEIRAKVAKAIGLLLAQQAEAEPVEGETSGGPAGGKRAAVEAALGKLRRAYELDARSGVKKQIERLERSAGQLAAAAEQEPTPESGAPSQPAAGQVETPPAAEEAAQAAKRRKTK